MTKNEPKKVKESYKPDKQLINDLTELLQFIELKNSVKKKQESGARPKYTKEEQEYVNLSAKEKESKHASFYTRKTRFINEYLYPTMGNLLTILEWLQYTPLREIFDANVRALLFSVNQDNVPEKRRNNEQSLSAFIANDKNLIHRLFNVILSQKKPDDYQLLILNMMQRKIWEVVYTADEGHSESIGKDKQGKDILIHVPSHVTTQDLSLLRNVGETDIGRAVSWIDHLASEAKINMDKIKFNSGKRPISF